MPSYIQSIFNAIASLLTRLSQDRLSQDRLSRCRLFRGATKRRVLWASRVCLVGSVLFPGVGSVQGQSPVVGSAVTMQPSAQAPAGGLTSKDYLRMMEQANERSGISATGGNYRGALPRPAGSLDQPFIEPTSPAVSTRTFPVIPSATPRSDQLAIPPSPTTSNAFRAVPSTTIQPVPNLASPAPYAGVESYSNGSYSFSNPNVVNPNAVNNAPANYNVKHRPVGAMPEPTAASFDGPRWTMRYAPVWIHRSGDENLTYTQGTTLSPFGADFGTDITVGFMANPMDSYEFSFLGSLRWNRSQSSAGPVNASLVSVIPEWLTNFTNASQQHQVQSASYRSYGLHKRWLTDEINNYRVGCEVIEYSETLSLDSKGSAGNSPSGNPAVGTFSTSAGNSLFGWSGGLEHWRPMGEKFSIGGAADAGLYLNSAESSFSASSGTGLNMKAIDDEISIASMFALHLRSRYQLGSNWTLYGGYRWWVLTGVATVDDQDHRDLLEDRPIATSSDDSILFHGADAGIEWRF